MDNLRTHHSLTGVPQRQINNLGPLILAMKGKTMHMAHAVGLFLSVSILHANFDLTRAFGKVDFRPKTQSLLNLKDCRKLENKIRAI